MPSIPLAELLPVLITRDASLTRSPSSLVPGVLSAPSGSAALTNKGLLPKQVLVNVYLLTIKQLETETDHLKMVEVELFI